MSGNSISHKTKAVSYINGTLKLKLQSRSFRTGESQSDIIEMAVKKFFEENPEKINLNKSVHTSLR